MIDKIKMISHNRTMLAIAIICVITLQFPTLISEPGPVFAGSGHQIAAEGYGHISEISYQWQEINGFCHWAASTMALRSAGVSIDLHELFVASGIGLSAAYIRYEESMILLAGMAYRQMVPMVFVSELYGLEYSVFIDPSLEIGSVYSQAMGIWGLNHTELHGRTDAFDLMRTSINEGYPLLIWADPYYLPAADYDIVRALGLHTALTGSGHSILIVGYNDTSETAWIADPGVGAFGDDFGYPDDGRWYYNISYNDIDSAWKALSYGACQVKSGGVPSEDFQTTLVDLICDRLQGERSSYAPGQEDLFFVTFGADAFRALGLDMTPEGLSVFLENYETHEERILALANFALVTENMITLQYLSYRKALEELPNLLPSLNLQEALTLGAEALPHFELMSDNTTLVSFDLSGHEDTLLWDTFVGLVMDYDSTQDFAEVVIPYAENISAIASHLTAIADSWDALAQALRNALSERTSDTLIPFAIATTMVTAVIVAAVILRRRK